MTVPKGEILLVVHSEFMGDKLFQIDVDSIRSYEVARLFLNLRQHMNELGYEIKTMDLSTNIRAAYAVFFFEVPKKSNSYYQFCKQNKMEDRMYLLVGEPPAVVPENHDPKYHQDFKRVLTFNSDLIDNKKYFRINYVLPMRFGEKVKILRSSFSTKKLLCLVSGNKFSSHSSELYGERIKATRFMEKHHPEDFDLYGTGWETPIIHARWASALKINGIIYRFWPKNIRINQFKTYKGSLPDKSKIFPNYKFTIAYENSITRGYISEKILEAMLYGTVPIYLGDPDIEQQIPQDCFIDKRDFADYKSIYKFINSMDKKTHNEYLDKIEKFLNSEKIYPFTIDAFIESFEKMLE